MLYCLSAPLLRLCGRERVETAAVASHPQFPRSLVVVRYCALGDSLSLSLSLSFTHTHTHTHTHTRTHALSFAFSPLILSLSFFSSFVFPLSPSPSSPLRPFSPLRVRDAMADASAPPPDTPPARPKKPGAGCRAQMQAAAPVLALLLGRCAADARCPVAAFAWMCRGVEVSRWWEERARGGEEGQREEERKRACGMCGSELGAGKGWRSAGGIVQ